MKETVSVSEARGRFAQLLRGVRDGRSYVVTAHGRPVAQIVPASMPDRARAAAHACCLRGCALSRPSKSRDGREMSCIRMRREQDTPVSRS
ncbi:MAG: type II toxin-antitoxin system Phd/YefM family antitoxin [Dongiaceae bacterium]